MVLCGISTCFQVLSPCLGQIVHALLTRPPLEYSSLPPKPPFPVSPLDLHVLGTPPAFVLSQDQTLLFNPFHPGIRGANLSRRACYSFRNLTVLFHSSLYRFQGSQAASAPLGPLSRGNSRYYTLFLPLCQYLFFSPDPYFSSYFYPTSHALLDLLILDVASHIPPELCVKNGQ